MITITLVEQILENQVKVFNSLRRVTLYIKQESVLHSSVSK